MSRLRLILRSLVHHWRINVAVAMGVMAGTAVLTGALLVGDSMHGSLKHLTIDRLGRIDESLTADRFFHASLAEQLQSHAEFQHRFTAALPAILVSGSVENPNADARDANSGRAPRAGRVSVIGCDARFWEMGAGGPPKAPSDGQIVLNEPLAAKIGAQVGREVLLRIGEISLIPPDSPLGRKNDTVRNRRLTVIAIIPAEGLGRFSLQASQRSPYNAFVTNAALEQILDEPDKVNAILVAGDNPESAPAGNPEKMLQKLLHPTLADYGLSIEKSPRGYFNFSSDRMVLDRAAEDAALKAFADHPQPVLTYLANYITAGEGRGKIPYSTITALDLSDQPPLGPFLDTEGQKIGPIGDDEIVLNQWAADDLKAQGVELKSGDAIHFTYFEPESTHGQIHEVDVALKLKAVADMNGPAGDPDFTPMLAGVTDQKSMSDWDPPFPFDPSRVRSVPPKNQDDLYWRKYKATPKAFISLAKGRKLWSSRFGQTTSIRFVPAGGSSAESLAEHVKIDPGAMGFEFTPVKRQGLVASAGTTPFNLLFLGFSFFIIAAAMMLVALLFQLAIEQRAGEIGILEAVGMRGRLVARLLAGEALAITALGGLLGVAAGVGYAWLMLAGLRTWWLGAITTPFLQLYITPASLLFGYISGVLVSLLTIVGTLRRMRRLSIRRLLSGQADLDRWVARRRPGWSQYIAVALGLAAIGVGLSAARLGGEAQAGAFFGSGALVLAALLALLWSRLRSGSGGSLVGSGGFALGRLAVRNGARNPSRSTLTIGLVAAASFLIVAISAFRLDPAAEGRGRESGSGGFTLLAESSQPIYQDLNSPTGREALGIAETDESLKKCSIVPLRVRAGDDASCLNLYQPTQPRVLGVTPALVERGGFAWAETAATSPEEKENPWQLLDKRLPRDNADEVTPVILDASTALYSLHLGDVTSSPIGKRWKIEDARGRKIELQVVGLLKNSIFQGDLLIGEPAFSKYFPDVSGYRYFLIDAPPGQVQGVQKDLEDKLGDYGFETQTTVDRLDNLLRVQNTYLLTFQSLGSLGLLLGTFGLATVQLRSVLERRGELALLRAAGFTRHRLGRLVMIENALLLAGGLAVGVLAATIAVLPHLVGGEAAIPWLTLAGTLAVVLAVGLLAGLVAVRATLRAELLPALRGE